MAHHNKKHIISEYNNDGNSVHCSHISRFPRKICNFTHIVKISIMMSDFTKFPFKIKHLKNLKHVFINHGKLTRISLPMCNIQSLQVFQCYRHPITKIPLIKLKKNHSIYTNFSCDRDNIINQYELHLYNKYKRYLDDPQNRYPTYVNIIITILYIQQLYKTYHFLFEFYSTF